MPFSRTKLPTHLRPLSPQCAPQHLRPRRLRTPSPPARAVCASCKAPMSAQCRSPAGHSHAQRAARNASVRHLAPGIGILRGLADAARHALRRVPACHAAVRACPLLAARARAQTRAAPVIVGRVRFGVGREQSGDYLDMPCCCRRHQRRGAAAHTTQHKRDGLEPRTTAHSSAHGRTRRCLSPRRWPSHR